MAKHKAFNADRFTDKFKGREELLRAYVAKWADGLDVDVEALDIPAFKKFLVDGTGDRKDEFLEGLYRARDLATERGHEDLVAACATLRYEPDPDDELPVECLSLKVLTEDEDAFALAYDRNAFFNADRFTIYRAPEPKAIGDLDETAAALRERLEAAFKGEKNSDRVLVRAYAEGDYANFIVYHEKRTRATLVFKGGKRRPAVSPHVFRPAQQDFISYNPTTGQIEIEASIEKEEATLRREFAACALNDETLFEGEEAGRLIDLSPIASPDFESNLEIFDLIDGSSISVSELHFRLPVAPASKHVVRSKDVLKSLTGIGVRAMLHADYIDRVVFKFVYPDDKRGKRVEVSGRNRIKFRRQTHAEDVITTLTSLGIIRNGRG